MAFQQLEQRHVLGALDVTRSAVDDDICAAIRCGCELKGALKKAKGKPEKRAELDAARAETLEVLKRKCALHQGCAEKLLLKSCGATADIIDLVLVYAGTADKDVVARCSDENGTFDGRWRKTAGGPQVELTTVTDDGRRITWRHWCVRVDGDSTSESIYPVLDHKTTDAKRRLPPAAAVNAACKTRVDVSRLDCSA